MNSCSHPHVLVTGASSGIGRATALRLAVTGYHVFAGVRRPADGTALGQGAGREITPVLLDVTNAGQINDAADVVAGHTGKDSRRMAILAAVLPTPALDALRRRLGGQPAPGSRADAPQPARAAEPAMR